MIQVLRIKVLETPTEGGFIKFNINIDGDPIIYSPGGTSDNTLSYSDPTGTPVNAFAFQLYTLFSALLLNPAVSYSWLGDTVTVTINSPGVITINDIHDVEGKIEISVSSIFFSIPIDSDKLRMAYNNDVIEFYSNNEASPKSCTIVSDPVGINVTLYPNPQGSFFFNFKTFAAGLINTRNFEDTLATDLPNNFIYDFTAGTYLSLKLTITIFLDDEAETSDTDEFSLAWLAGVQQLNDYYSFSKDDHYLLSPFKRLTANHNYMKYWEGYPFDFSYYTPYKNLYLKNEINLMETSFDVPGKVSRIVFSDGRTDETIESMFPITEGYNSIRVMYSSVPDDDNDRMLILEKMPYTCGVYFKWLNKYGGYSYWLFGNTYSLDRNTKALGELDRDYTNLEDSFTRSIQIGRESQDTIRAIAELLTPDERLIVEGVLESPKVYMFTGQPFSRAGVRDWIEVNVKTQNARVKNAKENLTNFQFDFELPQRYTQTL